MESGSHVEANTRKLAPGDEVKASWAKQFSRNTSTDRMDELAELMGVVSDSESMVASPWDPASALAGPGSTGSCTVMDPFTTIGDLTKGALEDGESVFPDSDDSEVKRRRRRHKQMPDPLKKLLKKEIQGLLEFLRWDLPRSAHILSFIKMILNWKESVEMKRSGMKYKILVSREDCGPEYPLTIASYVRRVLKEAFKYSKCWRSEAAGSCEWAVCPAEAAAEFLSVKHESDDLRYTSYPVHMYWMSPDAMHALEFEVPREFKTNPLNAGHVNTVNHYWGRHRADSQDLVQQMILNNPTIGAFTFEDEFVGWALQTHYGALDVVYTIQRHRKKGSARSLLLSLARTLDDNGSPAHAFAHRDDQDTKTFLTESGFTFVSEYFYFYIDPPLQSNPNFKDK